MPRVFTQQYATQQQLQEKKRKDDEARLLSKKKAVGTVMAYAFIRVSFVLLYTTSYD